MNALQPDNASALEATPESLEVTQAVYSGSEWLSYAQGSVWILQGGEVVIEHASAVDRLVVRKVSTNERVEVHRTELAPAAVKKLPTELQQPLEQLDTREMEDAKRKESAVAPYSDGTPLTTAQRTTLAAQFGVDASTIKRWLKAYRAGRHWSVFLTKKPGPRAGMPKIHSAVEAIIAAATEAQAQVDQDFTAQTIIATIEQRCLAARLPAPSLKTVRVRVKCHQQYPSNLPADVREEHKRIALV